MPTKRQLRTRNRLDGLTDIAQAWFLDQPTPERDWEVLILEIGTFNHRTQATAADLWERYGATLLEEFSSEHPGQRPRYWWEHEAPEPRQHLGETTMESQARFLERHSLLFPGEKRRLAAEDFEPEVLTPGE